MRGRVTGSADDGAVLLIALFIVTTIALVTNAVLSRTAGSLQITVAMRDQSTSAYDADGAGQIAINQIRRSTFNNSDDGTKCFGNAGSLGQSDTLPLPAVYPATTGRLSSAASSASVVCTPEPGTGAQGSPVPITSQNKPGNAILTLGSDPSEDGVHVKANNNAFRVHGSIVSDSNIAVTNGSIVSNAAVLAHTGCSGPITSNPAPVCNAGTVSDPNYTFEPAYGTPANVVPSYRAVPSTCPGGVVTFSPGYYDDATALNNLTTGNGSCASKVWWFTPGTYYFDFHNNLSDPSYDSVLGSGGDTWTVSRGTLLAGTPTDAAGNVVSVPPASPSIPGACQNPINSTSAVGVQFIFGGDSQLVISGSGNNAANAEICGSYSATRPPIALYGLQSGSDSVTNLSGASTLKTTNVVPTNFGNASVANLAASDGAFATWANSSSGNKTGTVTLNGFAPLSAVPAGSVLKSATLRVVHREPASTSSPSAPTVTVTPTGGSALSPKTLTLSAAAWKTDTVDLTSSLAAAVHDTGFSGASMVFSAGMKGAGNEDLDTMQLDLSYIAPAFRAETTSSIPGNCLASTYPANGSCAVLSTSTSYAGAFFIQGTTYAPVAPVDLTLNNVTSQVLRFGLVSRTLWIKETGSLNYSGPVIEVPDNSPGYGIASTILNLKVYVCVGVTTSTCDASGKLALVARVQIWDPSGDPSDKKRQVAVLSWSQRR
jgi:hypothetical protein